MSLSLKVRDHLLRPFYRTRRLRQRAFFFVGSRSIDSEDRDEEAVFLVGL